MSEPFLPQTGTTALVNVKLTDKGRELLTKGFFEQDTFDIVKFAFGDSEVNYAALDDITGQTITTPDNYQVDFKSKLYAFGIVPAGKPRVVLDVSSVVLTVNQSVDVSVKSFWPPVEGEYLETYVWENLGPLEDYDFDILTSNNTRNATIVSYDIRGKTKIKVTGQITGKYAILDVTIG